MMQISSRFTVAIHILAALEIGNDKVCTSEVIASSIQNNPVVVRRIIGMLKKAKLVGVNIGCGAAYLLKSVKDITLFDVYKAVDVVEDEKLFQIHENTNQECIRCKYSGCVDVNITESSIGNGRGTTKLQNGRYCYKYIRKKVELKNSIFFEPRCNRNRYNYKRNKGRVLVRNLEDRQRIHGEPRSMSLMKTLFDKTVIKKIALKNRIVRSATQEIMAQEDGHLNDRLYELYKNLAKGGVGLIITSSAYITEDSKSVPNEIGFYSDEFIA